MNFSAGLRDRRPIFAPTHYSIANYCTDTKNEMKTTFGEDIFHNLHLIPDPLKKNLADTIISEEKMTPKNEFRNNVDMKTNENAQNQTEYSPLTGIANFISGVFNVISGAMFSKRKTPDFDPADSGEMAVPSMWQNAKSGDENKISLLENCVNDIPRSISVGDMSDCRAAVTQCQNKLEQVRLLLSQPVPCTGRLRRRPKKVFIEPTSVEDSFEDAFTPEDFETLSNSPYLEYVSPICNHRYDFNEIDGPKTRIQVGPAIESTDVVQNLPKDKTDNENISTPAVMDQKEELVASCEDKLSKLKALLQERRQKSKVVIEPEPVVIVNEPESSIRTNIRVKDKRYKNTHRCTDKRRQSKMRRNIQDDLQFANEINTEELSSVENSPSTNTLENYIPKQRAICKDYFDEVSGRFHSTSISDSEDCFQIVFNDCPKRVRTTSDCDSEDSFIVFEESPEVCYTSNDVFGDSSDSDSCDSDFSDSGCGTLMSKLSHTLSKSVSNLTDDSLYVNVSEDEVDCSRVENLSLCENLPTVENLSHGLLLDSRKKQLRKNLPAKTVRFSEQPPKTHVMRVWAFAARQARAGHWERYALDRERFKRRIADVDVAVSWVLRPQHRSRVMFQRFMPWWNVQKRQELTEKKQKEAEDKATREAEEERLAQEQDTLAEKEAEVGTVDDTDVADVKEDDNNSKKGDLEFKEGTKLSRYDGLNEESGVNETQQKPAEFKHQDSMGLIPKRIEVNEAKSKENEKSASVNQNGDTIHDTSDRNSVNNDVNEVNELENDSFRVENNDAPLNFAKNSRNDFKQLIAMDLVEICGADIINRNVVALKKNCSAENVSDDKQNMQIVLKDDKLPIIDLNFITQVVKDT